MQVFLTSPWIPAAWVRAHGLKPRGVWPILRFAFEPAVLPAGTCAFGEAVLRLAREQTGSAIVFATHCDQLRRSYDALPEEAGAKAFLFNLPATWQTPVGSEMFCAELERLGRFLVTLGGRTPSAESLAQTIAEDNDARTRLLAAASWCPARQYAEAVASFHWDGSVELPQQAFGDSRGTESDGLPLAVVGGPLTGPNLDLLGQIESAGGRVVLNATEAGERSLFRNENQLAVPSRSGESLAAGLSRLYLENCRDVFQRPNTRLYTWLRERLAARRVRGIILWHFVGCDLWRAEFQTLREAFGLPILLLESSEAAPCENRNLGRLEAFLEALQ